MKVAIVSSLSIVVLLGLWPTNAIEANTEDNNMLQPRLIFPGFPLQVKCSGHVIPNFKFVNKVYLVQLSFEPTIIENSDDNRGGGGGDDGDDDGGDGGGRIFLASLDLRNINKVNQNTSDKSTAWTMSNTKLSGYDFTFPNKTNILSLIGGGGGDGVAGATDDNSHTHQQQSSSSSSSSSSTSSTGAMMVITALLDVASCNDTGLYYCSVESVDNHDHIKKGHYVKNVSCANIMSEQGMWSGGRSNVRGMTSIAVHLLLVGVAISSMFLCAG